MGNGYMKAYHCILDCAMFYLKPAEFTLFYCIYRKTIGWNKYVDRISLSQFIDNTNLTKQTVFTNLANLEKSKWIHVMRETTGGGLPFNKYSLGEVVYKLDQSNNHTSLKTRPVVVYKLDQSKQKVVYKLDPQKIGLKDIKKNPPPPDVSLQEDLEEAEDIFSKLRIKKKGLLTQFPAKYICDMRQRYNDKLNNGSVDNPGAYFVTLLEDPDHFDKWSAIYE